MKKNVCFINQTPTEYERNTTYQIRDSGNKIYKKRVISLDYSRIEFSAKSGKLLKVMTAGNIQSFKNRYYPTRVTMEDKLRKNSKTEMMIKTIQFDAPIPKGTFTERNLMRR
jgi:outer membrane lipoprotein-sorting protein